MQVFVHDAYTMIAAPVQCDVDGVSKRSHFARVRPMGIGAYGEVPHRCSSCPSSDLGSSRDPKGVRLVALTMQLEHAVDQVLHRATFLRDGGEVTQVPPA